MQANFTKSSTRLNYSFSCAWPNRLIYSFNIDISIFYIHNLAATGDKLIISKSQQSIRYEKSSDDMIFTHLNILPTYDYYIMRSNS